jgi:hypothetical protein
MDIDASLFVHARLFRCQHAYEQNTLMQRVHVLEMVRESKWNAAVADERKVAVPGKRAGGCSISLVRSSAITTALSPDNTMFTPVICSSAIEDRGGVEIARCPCRKLTLGYIGGAADPRLAPPMCNRQSGRRAGLARPSAVTNACGLHRSIFDTI